jgi:hypothetical protein
MAQHIDLRDSLLKPRCFAFAFPCAFRFPNALCAIDEIDTQVDLPENVAMALQQIEGTR